MFESLAKALAAGLSLWESKEKTKYVDRLIELKRNYREELSKPIDVRSDDVLARIEYELRDIADAFASSVGIKTVKD